MTKQILAAVCFAVLAFPSGLLAAEESTQIEDHLECSGYWLAMADLSRSINKPASAGMADMMAEAHYDCALLHRVSSDPIVRDVKRLRRDYDHRREIQKLYVLAHIELGRTEALQPTKQSCEALQSDLNSCEDRFRRYAEVLGLAE